MVQNTVTLRRPNSVGNGLCPVPLAPERRGGRSLQRSVGNGLCPVPLAPERRGGRSLQRIDVAMRVLP